MFKWGAIWFKFKKELLMVWAVVRSPKAPWWSKLIAVLALVYVIFPLDIVTDLMPVLGWIDDGIVAIVLFKLAIKLLPSELRAQFEAALDKNINQKNAYKNTPAHEPNTKE